MKFTKDDARKELSTQMTARGEKLNLSERSLNEQLDTLIPLLANDETELQDFVSKVLPIFKTADANVRNDVSAGINDYKKANPTPTPAQPTPNPTKTDDDVIRRLAELEEKLAQKDRDSKIAALRGQLASKVKEKGVKDDEWTNSILSEISITEDLDVDAKAESLLNLYNKAVSKVQPGVTPDTPGGNGDDRKEIEKAIKEASALVAAESLSANK
jgi:hypothetical protein